MRNAAQQFSTILLLTLVVALACAPRRVLAQLQFDQWTALQFTPAEISDPLVSGLNADPDGDALRNLLEYALAGNPKVPGTSPLPVVGTAYDHLALSFTRVKAALDLSYVVEVSHDLIHWYSGDAFTLQLMAIDRGETETQTVQDRTPMSSLTKRFIRLRVTRQPVETGLRLWLDAGARVTKDGSNLVSNWGDGSGLSNDASQPTAALQPVWIDNAINGRPVLRFDGQNDRLNTVVSPGTDDFTLFVIAKTSATHEIDPESITGTAGTAGQKYLFGAKASGVDAGAGMSLGTNGLSIYEQGDSYMPPLAAYSGPVGSGAVLAEVQYQAKRPTIYLHGQLVRVGLTSPRPHVFAPVEIGAGDFGAFAGDVAEVMVYNRALSSAERATVEAYLSRKYALHIIPEVTITDPPSGSSFSTERVDLHGQVVHASVLDSLLVNGVHAFVTGNSFEARNVPLIPGKNTVTAIAADIFGHIGSASIAIGQGAAPVDPVTLQVDSTSGFGPLSVTFQTAANVPGQLVEVRYDFNGDGIVDQVALTLNPVTHLYSLVGDFFPIVTVVTTAGSFSSVGGFFSTAAGAITIHIQAPPEQENLANIVNPVDIKVTSDGSIYVLSKSTSKVTQFDAAGATIRSIAGIGLNPSGFDVDSTGKVYVALTGNNQVLRLTPLGATFATDTQFNTTGKIGRADGASGTANGEFNQPYDVAVTPNGGFIYVSDSGNHRIQKFASNGQFLAKIGQAGNAVGQLSTPKGITFCSDGNIYVADSANNRLAIIRADTVIDTIGEQGNGPTQFQNPTNVSGDSTGIYVADYGNDRIVALSLPNRDTNEYASRWVSTGAMALSQATSVAAAATLVEDRIYIADTGNNQIQKVRLPKPDPTSVWANAKANLAAGNVEAALTSFTADSGATYRQVFQRIGAGVLAQWVNEIGALSPIFIENEFSQYRFEQMLDGVSVTFFVTFMKENGQWKVAEF